MTNDDRHMFEKAMSAYLDLQQERVRAMYNRHRAVFAEFLAAQYLPGAEVEEDPSSPWDLRWPVNGTTVHIQVKCSGEYLPHHPNKPNHKVNWDISLPKTMWDQETGSQSRTRAHPCDLWVLCRHTGEQIQDGWTFAAVLTQDLPASKAIRPSHFTGVTRLAPRTDLERQARHGLTALDDAHATDTALDAYLASFDADARTSVDRLHHQVANATDTSLFVEAAYTAGVVLRFDWRTWAEGRTPDAPMTTRPDALRMLTAIVRSDRFADGTLEQSLTDGTIAVLLDQLARPPSPAPRRRRQK